MNNSTPPPPPGWQPPAPQYDPAAGQPQFHQQYQPQPVVEEKPKVSKWVWWVAGFAALAGCGALIPDTDDSAGDEETVEAAEPAETTVEVSTTAEVTTTTTEPDVEEAPESSLSDEEVERLAQDATLQIFLNDRWPLLAEVNRQDPEAVQGIAEASCEVMSGAETEMERGARLLVTWNYLKDDISLYFDGPEDFAEFMGLMAAYECPDVLE